MTTGTLIPAADEISPAQIDGEWEVPQFPGVIGTFMGRDALSLAISHLDLGENDTVVLPVYTCQDVIKQFVRNCQVRFYDVGADLTIDPDELRTVFADSAPVKMLLITNYFGFLQPYRRDIKKFAESNGACLVEDCAHSLLTEGSGQTGDLSTYSFRKILPVRDGGGLVVNRSSHVVSPKYHHRLYSDTLSFLAFAKSLLKVRTERFSRARIAAQTEQALPLPSKNSQVLPLSRFARHRLKNISLSEVVEKRRVDFSYWSEIAAANPNLTPMFADLPAGVCPLGFALRVNHRESLERRAQEKGIHLRVHWRLEANLGSECPTSHQLSKDILTLPIYPELDARERDVLTGIMRQA